MFSLLLMYLMFLMALTLNFSYVGLLALISAPSFILAMWFLLNKGHLLISLLLLEALTASIIPICTSFSVFSLSSPIIIFLFITIAVCEACVGLAALLSSIRSKTSELSNSSFFTH